MAFILKDISRMTTAPQRTASQHVAEADVGEAATRLVQHVTSGFDADRSQSYKLNTPTTKTPFKPSPRRSATSSRKPKSTSMSSHVFNQDAISVCHRFLCTIQVGMYDSRVVMNFPSPPQRIGLKHQ
jgi:hypothetical protein